MNALYKFVRIKLYFNFISYIMNEINTFFFRFSLPRLSPTKFPHAWIKLCTCLCFSSSHSNVHVCMRVLVNHWARGTLYRKTSMRVSSICAQRLCTHTPCSRKSIFYAFALPTWNPYKPFQLCHSLKPRHPSVCA